MMTLTCVIASGRRNLTIVRRSIRTTSVGNASRVQTGNDAYLETPHWEEKRALVLKRAGGMCEGCGLRAAKQVHHLTYRNAFNAFLFQLVAICKECHDRYHAEGEPDHEHESEAMVEDYDDFDESRCCACRYQSSQDGQDWCGRFDVTAVAALAEAGPCGPNHGALDPLR